MSPTYNLATVNARLTAVLNNIDGGGGNGFLILLANSTVISTIQLARPSGVVSGGVLTFVGTLVDPSASGSGTVTTGHITDSNGTIIVSGLTAGNSLQTADIIIANGLNTAFISAGQSVQVLAAQIVGS